MLFEDLNLMPQIMSAIKAQGYEKPTPIQEQAIGVLLEGKDVLGTAQTGTGKTAAFALPILQMLAKEASPKKHALRALVLSPTRELAIQIKDSFIAYGRQLNLRSTVVYGGVSQVPQVHALRAGVDILIATPGRLLDLMNQKVVNLSDVKYFVLDEADHMLDMGFIHDVNKIIANVPAQRQTMLFSATMPKEIADLAANVLKDPVRVAVAPVTSTLDTTEQMVYFVHKHDKKHLLIHLLKTDSAINSVLVFSRTKHGADKLVTDLLRADIKAVAIHGNKSQSARQLALNNFKAHKVRVLVATDIAARGIDVQELSHVINFDLPDVPETYVHRIGRTGRAGLSGIAISFCDEEEIGCLRDIQRFTGKLLPVVKDHPFAAELTPPDISKRPPRQYHQGGNKSGERNQRTFAPRPHDGKFKPGAGKRYNGKPQYKKAEGAKKPL